MQVTTPFLPSPPSFVAPKRCYLAWGCDAFSFRPSILGNRCFDSMPHVLCRLGLVAWHTQHLSLLFRVLTTVHDGDDVVQVEASGVGARVSVFRQVAALGTASPCLGPLS